MTKLLIGIVILSVILPFNLSAKIFASGITVTYNGSFPATIGYYLNENATSVQVIIREWPSLTVKKTFTLGATLLGPNEVVWDGSKSATKRDPTVGSGVLLELQSIEEIIAPTLV